MDALATSTSFHVLLRIFTVTSCMLYSSISISSNWIPHDIPASPAMVEAGRPLDVRSRLPTQQPKEVRQCQCNQTACEWLTWYSIKALHELTSPRVCRIDLESRFDRVEPPTQFRRPPSLLHRYRSLRLLCVVGKGFRVLIIGRRNTGKITILENVTGSEEEASQKFAIKKDA